MPEPTPFGASMLQNFQFDPTFKNLNHGSFGTHPKQIQSLLRKFQSNAEFRPDPFIRYEQPALIDAARSALATYLNVPVNECVFVKNATTGVNTVLRNLVFSPGDVIIYFDTVYGAVGKTIQAMEETTPAKGRKVEYEFPITHDELVEKFRAEVKKVKSEGSTPKVAVFETVVSVPGIRFPFEDLVRVCREEGVLSLIDGAHGVGMFKLDLKELDADFFTSNCHKWLFTPRSSAVLHVPSRNQSLIRTTLPTSWGFVPASSLESKTSSLTLQETSKTRFEQLFEFVATADDSPYLCVPAAFEFRADVCGGEERIFAYLDELANAAGDIVASKLGTEVLQEVDGLAGGSATSKFRRCAMVNVRLPVAVGGDEGRWKPTRDGDCVIKEEKEVQATLKWVGETLIKKHGTFVPVFKYGGWLWTRLSAQVYLERKDFEWIGDVLREVCDKVRRGELD